MLPKFQVKNRNRRRRQRGLPRQSKRFQAVFYLQDPLKDSAAEAVRQLAGKT